MSNALKELKGRLEYVADLQGVAATLAWDQATYMPPGGGENRGRQLAAVSRLAHEAFVDSEVGTLLDRAERQLPSLDPDSDDARLVTVSRHDYERAVRVPAQFLEEFERHSSRGYQLWAKARPDDDFSLIANHLERTLEFSRRYAGFFPGYDHIADALIDESDRGMTVAHLRPLFEALRERLIPLVELATRSQEDRASSQAEGADPLRSCFPRAEQIAFGEAVIRDFGFDFGRGRQDLSSHPFATSLGRGDVRITTRIRESDLSEALFSTLHEAGHGMYEQGIAESLHGSPLAAGASSGVHESQSRLWENVVGRSLQFWSHYYPRLQQAFPSQFGAVSLDSFYRAVNRVSRSLIRTDADELTYNLHVLIRFDLECELLEGTLAVADLPEAWRARYRSDLGIECGNDRDGVLQDMHWYNGLIGGAFQGYTIGNILSAQFYASAIAAEPSILEETASGRFDALASWLAANVWRHGRKFGPDELLTKATGSQMTIEPYMEYLNEKYTHLADRT